MKKILLLVGILVSITATRVVLGQGNEGAVVYEVKINMHKRLPADQAEMKNMIPEFRISYDQLLFNMSESLYKPVPEDQEEQDLATTTGPQMRIRMAKNEVYTNQDSGVRIQLQEFMGKKYLMEDSLKVTPWKFTSGVRDILGYPCKQATYFDQERGQTIVAWYTESLRPFLGPENFNTLPGAVLLVDINDSERLITATKVELRSLGKKEMKIPSGGTKTTEPEFRKMVAAHREQRSANGGNVMIRN